MAGMNEAITRLAAQLPHWEADVPWMYLDTHQPPLVTVGIGCALDRAEALTLAWMSNGAQAVTPEEVGAAYDGVQKMQGGLAPVHYRTASGLTLPAEARQALMMTRLAGFAGSLRRLFPALDTWPVGPQMGALDLCYSVGPTGLLQYTMWCVACTREAWRMAAGECAANAEMRAYDARNAWRKQLFLEAVAT